MKCCCQTVCSNSCRIYTCYKKRKNFMYLHLMQIDVEIAEIVSQSASTFALKFSKFFKGVWEYCSSYFNGEIT